jgi:NAD-dependent SIR2 family protein deacetylase
MSSLQEYIETAARAVRESDALLISAGAGMGVDSGLPDFRGDHGFWQAYPPYASKGLRFVDLANPHWFRSNPAFAWGFYGHRLNLYRSTEPHRGFSLLLKWGQLRPSGYFVFTSNVDGQFHKAGFDDDRIEEVHGSIHHFQCIADCGVGIFSAAHCSVQIDEETMLAHTPLPHCPKCDGLARPNILMFGDWDFDGTRQARQALRFRQWLDSLANKRLVVIECGAGRAIPTVRVTSEETVRRPGSVLVRINVREPQVPPGHISIPLPAQQALTQIDSVL